MVFITAHADVPMGVQAMKAGAVEFLCKPFREQDLLDAVRTAISRDVEHRTRLSSLSAIRQHHETLTPREQEVMALVVSGMMNKQIAGKLGLSEITVKVHRASIMRKMNAKSLAELVRQADALDGANFPVLNNSNLAPLIAGFPCLFPLCERSVGLSGGIARIYSWPEVRLMRQASKATGQVPSLNCLAERN